MENPERLAKLLKNSRLFKGFSQPVLNAMTPLLTPCHFDAHNLICMKGDESDCLYIIDKGEVEISVSSSDGKIIVLGTLSDGDVFGEVGLLDKGSRTANVSAKTDVLLYRLGNPEFNTLSKKFGIEEFTALNSYICFLFRRATNNLEETVFLDADIRIAHKIRSLFEKGGEVVDNSFKVTISQESLGRMAALSREATNKALSHLESKGLIERKYKNITVPDVKKFLRIFKDGNSDAA